MTLVEFLTARFDEDERQWAPGLIPLDRPDVTALTKRMLAEVDAKRRIVESYQWYIDNADRPFANERAGEMLLAERHARILALSYVEHPDYRKEWKP
jgi:hypothetical protein